MPKFIIIMIILKGHLTTTGFSSFLHSVFLKHKIANFTRDVFLKGFVYLVRSGMNDFVGRREEFSHILYM